MELTMSLALPRERVGVPVARRIVAHALEDLGAAPACISDIELALSEACTNALVHTEDGNDFAVITRIDDERCLIDVVDTGRGFDSTSLGQRAAAPSAEQGRGIHLMRELVDSVHFKNGPERGTTVHLEKMLSWSASAPGYELIDGHHRAAGTASDEPAQTRPDERDPLAGSSHS